MGGTTHKTTTALNVKTQKLLESQTCWWGEVGKETDKRSHPPQQKKNQRIGFNKITKDIFDKKYSNLMRTAHSQSQEALGQSGLHSETLVFKRGGGTYSTPVS